MIRQASPALWSAAKWMALAAFISHLIALLYLGSLDEPAAWLFALILLVWQVGPIILATACAHASRDLAGQLVFLGCATALVALAVAVHVDTFDQPASSMAALALFVYPLFGYAAWCVVLAIAAVLGWRARDDWLKG